MTAGTRIREWLGEHMTSLGFYAYAGLLAPPLARALKTGLAQPEPHWLPGFFLLAVLLAEPFGLRWKLQFLRRRNRDDGFTPEGSMLGIFSAAGIAHMIVTTVAGMLILDGWGREGDPRWIGALVTGLILKEFGELFAGAGQSLSAEAPGHWRERLADVGLLAYGCVAYTVWWEALFDLRDVATESLGLKLILLPILAGLFAFLYLGMRLPFLLDESYLQPAAGRRGRIVRELAIGTLLGLYPAVWG